MLSHNITAFNYEGEDNSLELLPYAAYKFNPNWKVQIYGIHGLNENSLDKGVGMQLIYKAESWRSFSNLIFK